MKITLVIWAITAILVWFRLPSYDVVNMQTIMDTLAAGVIGFMGVLIGMIAGSVYHSYYEAKQRVRSSSNIKPNNKRR